MAKSLALGTTLWVEDPENEGEYIRVGNLTNIPLPGPVKNRTEVTDFDSTAREYLATLPENGELSTSGFFNYEDEGQQVLLADAHDPDAPTRNFRVDIARQDVRFEFSGNVGSFVPAASGVDDAITFESVLQITGAVDIISPIPAASS